MVKVEASLAYEALLRTFGLTLDLAAFGRAYDLYLEGDPNADGDIEAWFRVYWAIQRTQGRTLLRVWPVIVSALECTLRH